MKKGRKSRIQDTEYRRQEGQGKRQEKGRKAAETAVQAYWGLSMQMVRNIAPYALPVK
jgi:hypothetical protein